MALSGTTEIDDDSFGVQLLADLKRIWVPDELGISLFSYKLCEKLGGVEGGPWAAWGRGRPTPGFNERDLARTLRPLGIKPRTVRVGNVTRKGYLREHFTDAWSRYVPEDNEKDAS